MVEPTSPTVLTSHTVVRGVSRDTRSREEVFVYLHGFEGFAHLHADTVLDRGCCSHANLPTNAAGVMMLTVSI